MFGRSLLLAGFTVMLTAASAIASALWAVDTAGVPADDHWLVQLDVRSLMAGRLGRWIDRIAERDPLAAQLAVAKSVSGIDARTDLDLVTLSGVDARAYQALLLVTGRLDRGKLETLVRAFKNHEVADYRDHPIHRWLQDIPRESRLGVDAHELFATLLGGPDSHGLVAGSERAREQAALDTIDGVAKPASAVRWPALALPDGASVLLSIGGDGFDAWQGLPEDAGMVRQVGSVAAVIAEKEGTLLIRASLVAVDAATGGRFASVADGLVSMAALDPRTRLDPALTALVDSVKLTRAGARVNLSAELSIELAERTWDQQVTAALKRK